MSLFSSSIIALVAAEGSKFQPYGYQSGTFNTVNSLNPLVQQQSELLNDDSYASSMYYDAQHNLLFFTGATYGTYFDSATDLPSDVKGAMGMSDEEGGRDVDNPHLEESDCFLGILKMPLGKSPSMDNAAAPWLKDEMTTADVGPKLIYARRFGTKHNSEVCSSILMLPKVNDALLQSAAQMKLALLGHVNPTPLSAADVKAYNGNADAAKNADTGAQYAYGGGERRQLRQPESSDAREKKYNRGGFLHSLSQNEPILQKGRAYGFMVDFDLSLTLDETFTSTLPDDQTFQNAYGAILGGTVLESSPLVYPTAMTQNARDANIVYVVSMHSDVEETYMNPEYTPSKVLEEIDGVLVERADMTVGGSGTSGWEMVGGVPKYGADFYVKVQQLTVTPYQTLIDVDPTVDERVKKTMESGWGFGFKLNDAEDVRPSSIVFVRGRTPNDDILLLGGTTKKRAESGFGWELDGFITKLIPPAPTPVADMTTGDSPETAIEDESKHPTKRIDSTTGRDETVTAICLPPPDRDGIISHAYVVGSVTADRGRSSSNPSAHDPNLAYILKLRLDDLSTVWKEQIPAIHPPGLGGDVLGEGCAVSPDGKMVYLSGTIDGGSVLNTGTNNNGEKKMHPVGGTSDVFVVAFDVDFGNVQWAKQLGTVFEDKLARGGGVACDNEGNVIIMGSSRGGMQRYRSSDEAAKNPNGMASDVFVMSLSRTNGDYVNAPYTGDGKKPVSASGTSVASAAAISTESMIEDFNDDVKVGGQGKAGTIIGMLLVVAGLLGAMFMVLRHRHREKARRLDHNGEHGGVLRGWENSDGDDFSVGSDNIPLGGRRTSSSSSGRISSSNTSPSGTMRIVRGGIGDDDWDEGIEKTNTSKLSTWMSAWGGTGGKDNQDNNGSVYSTGSTSSKRSYASKENSTFLASLRQEANATTREMAKKLEATDPRLDDGASIKNLLTHYRETKKDLIFNSDVPEGGKVVKKGKKGARRQRPPPPPPPRRKKKDQAAEESISFSAPRDGLSDFTII